MHSAAWALVSLFGPRVLPGGARPWTPPVPAQTWDELCASWREQTGPFDSFAVYQRVQRERGGVAVLLLHEGNPTAFVKLRSDGATELEHELLVLRALWEYRPRSFVVAEPLGTGHVGGWSYLAMSALPARRHRPPNGPPIGLIAREIEAALAGLPRPESVPAHWRPMHGDLTPWNLRRLADGRLVLFDWETAAWGPPQADEVLYRATAEASGGQPAGTSDAVEAIDYWIDRVVGRRVRGMRDQRLIKALAATLRQMKPAPVARPARLADGSRRPRVLVVGYACEPDRGSEPGAGWGLVRSISEFADCVVLVGPEHIEAFRAWEAANPGAPIRFVEVPEPAWGQRAKWHRIPWNGLYLFWQRRALATARALDAEQPFDAVYHATYSSYWLPSLAAEFDVPFVWGPVGGAATTPVRLWPMLGWAGLLDEVLDRICVRFASWWPSTRRTWRRATVPIVQNAETLARLPRAVRGRAYLLGHISFIDMPEVPRRERGSHLLFVSSLESRKGLRLALHALARTPEDVRLVVVGDGPQRRALERLAEDLGVAERVEFRGKLPRHEVFEQLAKAAGLVYPALREEGGMALGETLLSGTPVVVLGNGGPRDTASLATDPDRVVVVAPASVAVTARRMADAMTRFSRHPSARSEPLLDQADATKVLRELFERALGRVERGATSDASR